MRHKGELKMEIDNIVTEIKADLKSFCNGSNEKIAKAESKIDKVNEIVKAHDKENSRHNNRHKNR